MTKILRSIFLVLIVAVCMVAHAAPTASQVLKTSADRLRKMPSLTANLTITGRDGTVAGKILISADKFALTTKGAQSVWYNGKTQWVYNPAVDEINISEPTPDELTSVNPFMIINSFQKTYAAKLLKSAAGTYAVQLTPLHKNSDYKSVVISFDAKTYYPKQVTLNTRSVGTAKIVVSALTKGPKQPASKFAPAAKDYPTAEFVDLR